MPVPVVRGFTALQVETFVTKNLKAQFPFIKKVDLFNDDWETVISNFKLGVSTLHLPDYIILLLINSSAEVFQNRVAKLVNVDIVFDKKENILMKLILLCCRMKVVILTILRFLLLLASI